MLTTTLHPAFQSPIDCEIDGVKVNPIAILRDLLDTSQSQFDIAAFHKLTLQQLLVWCDQPAVRSLLEQSDALARRIAAHKAVHARPSAVQLLAEQTACLGPTPKDRETSGKAARSLLRMNMSEADSSPQRIAEMRLPKPASPACHPVRKHPANPRRARLPIPTDPLNLPQSITIPVFRFRPDSPILSPMSRIGPISPPSPYEVIDAATPTPAPSAPPPG